MISLVVASLAVIAGSYVLVTLLPVERPYRASATAVLSLSTVIVVSEVAGGLHLYRSGPLLVICAGFAVVAGVLRVVVATPATAGVAPSPAVPRVVDIAFVVLLIAAIAEYAWRSLLAIRLPPLGYDVLYYHLINVTAWVNSGTVGHPFAGLATGSADPGVLTQADTFPKNTELIASWSAVFTDSTHYVGLTQIGFVVVLALAVTGVCRALGIGRQLARLAGLIPVFCAGVVAQSDQLYVDIARVATVVLVFEFVVVALPLSQRSYAAGRRSRAVGLLLAGLALGLTIGVKSTDLFFIPAIALVVVGLLMAQLRRENLAGALGPPGFGARLCGSLAIVFAPAVVVGSYWYLRNWFVWHNPLWPYSLGPVHGRVSGETFNDLRRPNAYDAHNTVMALLHSWWAATDLYAKQVRGDQGPGALGLVWLVLGLPAVVLLLTRSRWNRRAAFAVVLPMVLATVASPAAFNSRYSFPLVAAGAIALAAVLDAGVAGRWPGPARVPVRPAASFAGRHGADGVRAPRRPLGGRGLAVAGCVIAAVCLSDTWAATRLANWYLTPADTHIAALSDLIEAVEATPSQRAQYGFGPLYQAAMQRVPAGAPVAFFADQTPLFTEPLTGPAHDHRLLVLPSAGNKQWSELVAQIPLNVHYVFLPTGSSLLQPIDGPGIAVIGTVWDGSIVYVASTGATATLPRAG
jgi:hypothetical protein